MVRNHAPERGLSLWLITRSAAYIAHGPRNVQRALLAAQHPEIEIFPSRSVSADSNHFRPKAHRSGETKNPARVDVLKVATSTSRDGHRRTGKERRTRKQTEYLYPKHCNLPVPASGLFLLQLYSEPTILFPPSLLCVSWLLWLIGYQS